MLHKMRWLALSLLSVSTWSACDAEPPTVEVAPSAWIHDPTSFTFSEEVHSVGEDYVDYGLYDGGGEPFPISGLASWSLGELPTYTAVLGSALDYTGPVELRFESVVDEADNPLDAAPVRWTAEPWVEEDPGLELGADPSRVELAGGRLDGVFDDDGFVVAAWSSGADDARDVNTAIRYRGEWTSSRIEGFGGEPALATDGAYVGIAGECFGSTCLARTNGFDGFASSDAVLQTLVGWPAGIGVLGRVIITAGSDATAVDVVSYEHVGFDDVWERLGSIPATEVIGRPLVGVPDASRPIVAFIDRRAPDEIVLRVFALDGEVWTLWGEAPVGTPVAEAWLTVRGNDAHLAWNDDGVHVVTVGPGGLSPIPAPTAAIAARIFDAGISVDGDLTVAWTDDGDTTQIARYAGFGWESLVDPRPSSVADPALGLWCERVPVLGWIQDGALHASLPNGRSGGASR